MSELKRPLALSVQRPGLPDTRPDAEVRGDVEAAMHAAAQVAEGNVPSGTELARLALGLADPRVRDTLYALAVGERAEQAEALWKLGIHLGIGGPVTYPRANRLRGIVADMPIEWLLLETDSPDQPLHGHQGHRNEPSRLTEVLATVADLRGEDAATIATASSRNARTLFNLA